MIGVDLTRRLPSHPEQDDTYLGVLCYAVARTLFSLLALRLVPRIRPGIHHTVMWLDTCLLLAAAVALSWYFLLAPST
jgi:hypothetical protein